MNVLSPPKSPSPHTPAVAIPGQKFKEEFKAEYGSMHMSWTIEGLDTPKIVYEVSKILGFLETPYGIPRVSRDSQGFWGIPRDSTRFQGFPGILGDSRGFQGFPRDSRGFQGIPGDSKGYWGFQMTAVHVSLYT